MVKGGVLLKSSLKEGKPLTFSYGAVNPNTAVTSWFMGTGNRDRLENNILGGGWGEKCFQGCFIFIFIAVGNK